MDDLPRTLRNSVAVAKALGFRYIWIDSLCIIQDADDDWADQDAAMTDIYGRSTLNVSASSSTGSDHGFLAKLPDHGVVIGATTINGGNQNETLYCGQPLKVIDLDDEAIPKRGWVFQERLVSPATLHYTNKGKIWECNEGIVLGHQQTPTSVAWKAQ